MSGHFSFVPNKNKGKQQFFTEQGSTTVFIQNLGQEKWGKGLSKIMRYVEIFIFKYRV